MGWDQIANIQGPPGVCVLIEVEGVYPPRPEGWPPGVQYVGVDEPEDWIDGDIWDSIIS